MKAIISFLLVLFVSGSVSAFDYASYEPKDLDDIITASKAYDPEKTTGQSLLRPPPRVHLHEKLARYPFKCDTRPIVFMLALAMNRTIDEMPPMNTCMQIESKKGEKIGAFIQDSIAGYVEEEYAIGQKIHLWSLWLFVNSSDKKPFFVVNGIGDAEQTAPPDQQETTPASQ
jgi:hypothetical protein